MRAVGLVAGEHVDIGAKRADIRQTVRGVADPVTAGDSTDRMRHRGDFSHRIFLPDDVGAMRETDKLHPFVQQGGKPVQLKLAGFGVDMPFTNLHAA